METDDVYTRYRAAWVAVYRRRATAKAVRYAVVAVIVLSLMRRDYDLRVQFLTFGLAVISLAVHVLVRCPRCRAWWPLGSDDDGQRKPCAKCGLRWGQEDELPEA